MRPEMNERAHNRISKAMSDYVFADLAFNETYKKMVCVRDERDRLWEIVRKVLAEESARDFGESE